MSLGWKLFISYLVIVVVGSLVLAVSTASIAPVTFSRHIESMRGMTIANMTNTMDTGMQQLEAELDTNFRQAVNSTLLVASVAAAGAAGIVSWYVSQRIIRPIRETVRASQRIAAGHYDERLVAYTDDELGELTRSFNQMAAALAETETIRQQLIADVSHELKTPLASITGYMEGLQDGVIEPTPETFVNVQRETTRLQRLVHDLQELSRAEGAQLHLNFQPYDASYLVQSTTDWLRPQFEDKGIELVLERSTKSASVLVDHDRVRQVLLNLLGNALQYTPVGGQVTAGWKYIDSKVCFFVRDTGIGLAGTDLERIFQRFYRVEKSRSRSSGGSGIGLTIAQHIIQAHGGQIWAGSAGVGQGSTFYFTLPVA